MAAICDIISKALCCGLWVKFILPGDLPIYSWGLCVLKVIREIAILFSVCFAGMLVSSLAPFTLPASIATMIILFLLLATKRVKVKHIETTANFFLNNMMVFFIPVSVGIVSNLPLVQKQIFQLLAVCVLSTTTTFLAAYYSTKLVSSLIKKHKGHS